MNLALVDLFLNFPEFSRVRIKITDGNIDIYLGLLTVVFFDGNKQVAFICYNDYLESKHAGSYVFSSDLSEEQTTSLLESMMSQAPLGWARHKQTIKNLLLKFCDKEIKEDRFQ